MLILLRTYAARTTYDSSPYNWTFYTGVGDDRGVSCRRRQQGTFIEFHADTIDNLTAQVARYEAELTSRHVPISPEWGQIWGTTATERRRLLSLG